MSVRHLDRILAPRSVAVVGASERAGSVGRAVLENLVRSFEGPVHAINPRHARVLDVAAVPSVGDLDTPPDLAVICTPQRTVPGGVEECAAAGVGGLVVITAGFGETGEAGEDAQAALAHALGASGLRAIGPNCVGVIVPGRKLNASFAGTMPEPGRLAFLSQSGAVCTAVLDWAVQRHIGFSHFVSVGNMLDVDFGDLIDYLAGDPGTDALLLYVESVRNARKFLSAARAFTRRKPIVAYKAGRFAESAAAAMSHTGAMAGADDVYDAAFRRAGIERVFELNAVFECAELLARPLPPAGPKLAIVTNAGGPGVVATDALIARGGTLAPLGPETMAALDGVLPSHWSHGNPVDIIGDAPAQRFEDAIRIILRDAEVESVLVVLAPQAMTDPTDCARVIARAAAASGKAVLAAMMGGGAMDEGIDQLRRGGVPVYRSVEDAVVAFMHLVSYTRNLETLYETPRDVLTDDVDVAHDLDALLDEPAGTTLTEATSKALLEGYGIPTTQTRTAASADEAVARAAEIGDPVVLKIDSPDISHKTDVGGVALDLHGDEAVRAAYERVVTGARKHRPDADVRGVTVQRMVDTAAGHELILGMKTDPTFGAAIMIGAGGTAAEVLQDRAVALPPVNERLARRMLESLRIWPLLQGHRGAPGVDLDRLVETIVRFSYLVAEHPRIVEADVNPLVAGPDGVVAVDARVLIGTPILLGTRGRGRHLAIKPYPHRFEREVELPDGTPLLFRPIRPEDEPAWHALLGACSPDSIWFRLGSAIRRTTHQMATRFCFIDYERELAIVAEHGEGDRRRLVAVGRLVADPDHATAEYAILVEDAWQGRGLGTTLTRYCLEVARAWGLKRIVAETHPDNPRMRRVFEGAGFDVRLDHEDRIVRVTLDLERAADAAPASGLR